MQWTLPCAICGARLAAGLLTPGGSAGEAPVTAGTAAASQTHQLLRAAVTEESVEQMQLIFCRVV